MAVYFIQTAGENAIKIGYAKEPQKRRAELQTGHHEELTVVGVIARGDMALERKLHDRFAKSHIRGEWFRPTEELLGFIEGVRACEDVPPEEPEPIVDRLTLWQAHSLTTIHRRLETMAPIIGPVISYGYPQDLYDLLPLLIARRRDTDVFNFLSDIERASEAARNLIVDARLVGWDQNVTLKGAVRSPQWEHLDNIVDSCVELCSTMLARCAEFDQVAIRQVRAASGNKCTYCQVRYPTYMYGRAGWEPGEDGSFACRMCVSCVRCCVRLSVEPLSPFEYLIDLDGRDAPILPRLALEQKTPPDRRVSSWVDHDIEF